MRALRSPLQPGVPRQVAYVQGCFPSAVLLGVNVGRMGGVAALSCNIPQTGGVDADHAAGATISGVAREKVCPSAVLGETFSRASAQRRAPCFDSPPQLLDLPSRHHVASSSGAAPRRAAPVRSLLVIWAGVGVLVLASCGITVAPVVRCVPGSLVLGCK